MPEWTIRPQVGFEASTYRKQIHLTENCRRHIRISKATLPLLRKLQIKIFRPFSSSPRSPFQVQIHRRIPRKIEPALPDLLHRSGRQTPRDRPPRADIILERAQAIQLRKGHAQAEDGPVVGVETGEAEEGGEEVAIGLVEGAEGPGGPVSVGEVGVRGGRVGGGGYDLGLVDDDYVRRERGGGRMSVRVSNSSVCGSERGMRVFLV